MTYLFFFRDIERHMARIDATGDAARRRYALNARERQKEDKASITTTLNVQPNIDERRALVERIARANDSAQKQKPGSSDPGFAPFRDARAA
jgi:cytochrome c-type biogenesis protein CcmH/NrfG